MSHIFVSYSRKDSECVNRIVNRLSANDFPIWFDKRNIEISADWVKAITQGIIDAEIFFLLWSENSARSPYVQDEINRAQNQTFGTHKALKFYIIRFDSTKLPPEISHWQAFDMRSGCTDAAIRDLLDAIPAELRKFNDEKPLKEQNMTEVQDTSLVRVPFHRDTTWGFKADIVGLPQLRFPYPPSILHVGLQFTRGVRNNLVKDVYQTVQKGTDPFWMLHIMGPINTSEQIYLLEPDPALWIAASQYISKIVKQRATESDTTLRIFAPIPGALLAGAMRHFERFWHIQLYHYEPTRKGYFQAVDQKPH